MTEYRIIKNNREVKKINCTEEFAASIALQVGGEYEPVTRERQSTPPKARKSRKQRIIDQINRRQP